jgi:hypothetical protein
VGQDHVHSSGAMSDLSDGFFGEDNSGKSRFDLLLDNATDAVHWIHDQTAKFEDSE